MDGKLPRITACVDCGSSAKVQQVGKLQWRCKCTECGEMGEIRNNQIDAIQNWNNPIRCGAE